MPPRSSRPTTDITGECSTCFNTCPRSNLGIGRAREINAQPGFALANAPVVKAFESKGIALSPVPGVMMIGDSDCQRTAPFIIGRQGATPISPKRVTPNVRANRKPLYRYQRID